MDSSFFSNSIGQYIVVVLVTGKTYIGILTNSSSSVIHLQRVRESQFQWNVFPGEHIVQKSLIQGYAVYYPKAPGNFQFLMP
jgi:small nuclear ribonucleoprotein (snRNP)-like protein